MSTWISKLHLQRHRWFPLAVLAGCAPLASPVLLLPPAAVAQTAPAQLGKRIDAIVDRLPFDRAHWGIEVFDPATNQVLYQRNTHKHFIPASNLKLVVAAAASHLLGPDFRYRTTIHGTGPVRDGLLNGDLVLRGTGDPTISGRYAASTTEIWESLADSLWARGVRRLSGGVVADQSAWDTAYVRGDWENYDLLWWYAAPVGALGFNDNAIDFAIRPGAAIGQPARITAEPKSSSYTFHNRTRTVAAGHPRTLGFNRVPGTDQIYAYGDIPLDAGPRTEHFAVVDPARYAGTAFRDALQRRGIALGKAEVRVVSDPAASPAASAPVLVEHQSPPLPQLIGPVLGTSQNWFAEQLVKTLGKERRGEGTWEAGLAVEREFLMDEVGIDSAAFVLRDASGLSAGNLITPHALVQLLAWARTSPNGQVFRAALPVSGQSGSLRARLADLPGRVAAKTGYIGNVDSLSGYVTMPDGREVVFSVVANASGLPSSRMKTAIDEIVRTIATGATQ